MKAVVVAFNQEKALVGAFSVVTNLRTFGWTFDVITNLRMELFSGYSGNVKRTTATATGSIVSSGGAHCCVEIIPSHSSSSLVPVPAKFQRHWSCTNMTITAQRPSICTWTGGHTRQDPHNFGNWKHVIPIKRTMEATRETVIIRSLSLH